MTNPTGTPDSRDLPTVVLAGGGSGGHISPGLAIAERLQERGLAEALFVCSDRDVDARMLRAAGARFVAIPARPPALHPRRAASFALAFHRSVRRCRTLLATERNPHVVALGGFVAAPAVAAARRLGHGVTLVNLDRPPGRANRWMSSRCDRVWTAIDLPDMPGFAERVVGVPLRRQAIGPGPRGDDDARRRCRVALGLAADRPVLLVTGASQGSESINGMLVELATRRGSVFGGWQVLHLAGGGADTAVRDAYAEAGVDSRVEPFVEEMGLAWAAADLAVSRAGANSVAEAFANAVPTLFLPYPYHRDQHQRHNAQPLIDIGGAILADDHRRADENARRVGPVLEQLMGDDATRSTMRARLAARPAPDAADGIATLLAEILSANSASRRGVQSSRDPALLR